VQPTLGDIPSSGTPVVRDQEARAISSPLTLVAGVPDQSVIAKALDRWGHIVLPVVLVAIGLFILIEGGAFAL
jgi:hypothetical protein